MCQDEKTKPCKSYSKHPGVHGPRSDPGCGNGICEEYDQ
jgi:hypothetical protein